MEQTHGAKHAARILAGMLGVLDDHGEEVVTAALNEALATGALGADQGNLLKLSQHLPSPPRLTETSVPVALRSFEVESHNAIDYDQLLMGGGK
jgi:hypothetical protein